MGKRKRINSRKRKILRKHIISSSLKNLKISSRKIRIVVNLIRNMNVINALSALKYNNRRNISLILSKVLLSTISNWKNKIKNNNESIISNIFIKEIKVDVARNLKRLRPAPQGRAHSIKKYSTHINITLQNKKEYGT